MLALGIFYFWVGSAARVFRAVSLDVGVQLQRQLFGGGFGAAVQGDFNAGQGRQTIVCTRTRMSGPSMEGVSTVMASPARTAAERPERLALV